MDQVTPELVGMLDASRQLGAALEGTGDDRSRAQMLAQGLHSLIQPALSACLINTADRPALGIVYAGSETEPPWAAPVAKALESWARNDTEPGELSLLGAAAVPLILCGERIRLGKTIYGVLAAAVEPASSRTARSVLVWAADLLALRLRVQEWERQQGVPTPDGQGALGQVELGELTAIVTHQFNNILNDIVLQLAVLERGNLPAEARTEATAIRQRSQQAAGLVKELQRYSRSFHAAPTPLDLNAVVQDVLQGLCRSAGKNAKQFEWLLAGGKRLTLRLEQVQGLPAVLGSVADLKRLLGLLLQSAAAALAGSGETIMIRTWLAESGPQLIVEDQGAGVTAEMMPRLFEPFTVARPGGDGLALAVCRGLARRMQASLRGDNRAEGGMVFVVSFVASKK